MARAPEGTENASAPISPIPSPAISSAIFSTPRFSGKTPDISAWEKAAPGTGSATRWPRNLSATPTAADAASTGRICWEHFRAEPSPTLITLTATGPSDRRWDAQASRCSTAAPEAWSASSGRIFRERCFTGRRSTTRETRRDQRQDLCTTEALRHGETQKIDELFWPSGTLGLFQCAVSLFQTSSHLQKAEDTEVLNLPLLACIRTMTQICAKKQEFRAW